MLEKYQNNSKAKANTAHTERPDGFVDENHTHISAMAWQTATTWEEDSLVDE